MIARMRRWVTPIFTRLNGFVDHSWKYHHHGMFPDHPYYFNTFTRYPELLQLKRFDQHWAFRLGERARSIRNPQKPGPGASGDLAFGI